MKNIGRERSNIVLVIILPVVLLPVVLLFSLAPLWKGLALLILPRIEQVLFGIMMTLVVVMIPGL